jgi:hypothetical protein
MAADKHVLSLSHLHTAEEVSNSDIRQVSMSIVAVFIWRKSGLKAGSQVVRGWLNRPNLTGLTGTRRSGGAEIAGRRSARGGSKGANGKATATTTTCAHGRWGQRRLRAAVANEAVRGATGA